MEEPQSPGCRLAGRGSLFVQADCSAVVVQIVAGGTPADQGQKQPGYMETQGIPDQLDMERKNKH